MIFTAAIRSGLAVVCASVSFAASAPLMASPSDAWAWKHRVVVVFAPHKRDASLTAQRTALAGTGAHIADRHMAVIEIVNGEAKTVMGTRLDVSASGMKKFLRKNDDRFEVFLLGKDTGVKLRSTTPVTGDDLFSLIDTMPMRRQEMTAGSGAKGS
ncbi:DUF4174 domain-containing protein [Roseibium sp.]|uniref:DUF4174 domain-containing protein n=1 Tax=Roseibium sp. TaxID=1936156 RepID=UPI003BA9950F